ncbi:hypothetical protein [Psychromonas algicola]|uniref:hypothetical protein n=1 Tax=Psychromonas algicola TaxID=2555642 RepID=UPI0010689E31|nr:hypothetical protein [Psychromonas sp. RZ5]TEW47118.1 hypothetical protein E2R67_12765 [Psychromonas sp. RZ5]
MKKMIKTAIATAITALSFNAHAEGIAASPFTYLEYSVGTVDYDYTGADDGDYSALSGSLELPMLLIPILSAELIDFDDLDITKLGAGSYLQFGDATHLYGLVHYNDYDSDFFDNDFSLTVGVRHAATENLYINAAITEYTDNDFFDGVKLSVGYHLHQNFSVSANYAALDSSDVLSIGARLSF